MSAITYDYDVIVVGAGNTALLTALKANETGAKVLVLEISPKANRGGNAYFTTGIYRIVHNGLEDVRELIEDLTEEERNIIIDPYTADEYYADYSRVTENMVDPEYMELIINKSNDAIRWMVNNQGVKMELTSMFTKRIDGKLNFVGPVPITAKGGGAGLCDYLFDRVENMDGIDLLYETGARSLLEDETGKVYGVKTKSKEGLKDYTAKSVILACGGWEANPEWRARYLGQGWDLAKVRGSQFNMGDGIKMAVDLGARPHGNWSACHAIFIEADAPQPSIREDTDKNSKRMYIFGLLVNVNGERFVDEGYSSTENTYSRYGKLALTQPERTVFQVFDAKGYDSLINGGVFHDYLNAPYTKGETVEELADKLGIPADTLAKTVADYNAAANHPGGNNHWYKFAGAKEDVETKGLELPKSSCAFPLDEGPYYAYAVECGITFTYGGLKTNKRGQVVDHGDMPIPGLYAAGEILGGTFYNNYAGALGQLTGVVTGTIAGENAVLDYQK